MGSLPDSKYIIQTDGYYFVESHDVDPSKGYVTVSAKGIANGLSDRPNDDCDFGPDTYNPNYSGSGIPYTQTSGIQEAINYVYAQNGGKIYIKKGLYDFTDAPIISTPVYKYSCKMYIPNYTNASELMSIIIEFEGETQYVNTYQNAFDKNAVANSGVVFWNSDTSTDNYWLFTVDRNGSSLSSIFLKTIGGVYILVPNTCGGLELSGLSALDADAFTITTVENPTTYSSYPSFVGYNAQGISLPSSFTYYPIKVGFLSVSGFSLAGVGFNGGGVHIQYLYTGANTYGVYLGSGALTPSSIYIWITQTDKNVLNGGGSTQENISIEFLWLHPAQYPNLTPSDVVAISNTNVYINNWAYYNQPSGTITYSITNGIGHINPLPLGTAGTALSPSISTNPPVSATAYQNTNPYDIRIYLPAYATTSGTAGSVAVAIGSSSTPSTTFTQFVSGSTSSSSPDTLQIKVPAGWYYEVTTTSVTLATATVVAD